MRAAIEWWRRRRRRPRVAVGVVVVADRAGLPAQLHPRWLYLVGDPHKWGVLRCPCGHGHDIDLNLAHLGRTRWTISVDHNARPSVSPSIDVRGSRRCHFSIKAGRVRWS